MTIKYDNTRDQFEHGYDAGQIVDGTVILDERTKRFVLVDEDGIGYDPQIVLQKLCGQKIRFTIISFESMEEIKNMMDKIKRTGG